MKPEDITSDALAGSSQLNDSAASEAVGSVADGAAANADALSLAELNKLTGKSFPTKEAALKSITDTFSYVGKKIDDVKKEVKAEIAVADKTDVLAKELEEMRKERFYDKNPQYADPSIRKLIERIGGNPNDIVNSEEFKAVYSKIEGYDKSQKLRTVLESNPRLASTKDRFSKAKVSQAKGELRGEALEAEVVNALLESLI